MERSAISIISIVLLASVVGSASAAAIGAKNVTAYYTNYNVEERDWRLPELAFCYNLDAGKSYEWRSKYYWTTFCGPVGDQPPESCGQCLKVTNTKTKAEATVRIIDKCSRESLDLDKPVFDQIDTDGSGYYDGHLIVDYEFVDCHDTNIRLYSE